MNTLAEAITQPTTAAEICDTAADLGITDYSEPWFDNDRAILNADTGSAAIITEEGEWSGGEWGKGTFTPDTLVIYNMGQIDYIIVNDLPNLDPTDRVSEAHFPITDLDSIEECLHELHLHATTAKAA